MRIWHQEISITSLNKRSENTLGDFLGIKFIEIGDDYLKATMPARPPAGIRAKKSHVYS